MSFDTYSAVLQNFGTLTLANDDTDEIFKEEAKKAVSTKNERKLQSSLITNRSQTRSSRRYAPYFWTTSDNKTVNISRFCSPSTQKNVPIDVRSPTTAFCESDYYRRLFNLRNSLDIVEFHDRTLSLDTVSRLMAHRSGGLTCSAQARKPEKSKTSSSPTLSVSELAAYLDDFLHIPKKMSYMAENMYT